MFEGLFTRGRNGDRSAEATSAIKPESTRPSIGLALGGGAARGFAHIGVLQALAAHGIVPDVIVGTSIGAVVGGCYAANQLEGLETWARGLKVRSIFSYLDISLSGSGLINGGPLASRLTEALGPARIEDMPVRFAAIATEFNTGHEIWLTRGRLSDAMRASYALPGIFPPVKIGGRWLVDGALVNPVPVSAARALGAEIVIAVNLSNDVFGHSITIFDHGSGPEPAVPEIEPVAPAKRGFGRFFSAEKTVKREFFGSSERPGISTVMIDAFNIMQDRITRARLAGDPPDMHIAPRVGQFGLFDFHRAEDMIKHGARATERAIEGIQEAIEMLVPEAARSPTPAVAQKPAASQDVTS